MSNLAIARRHAPSIAIPTPGGPLVRAVPDLGWAKVQMKGRIDVEEDMPEEARKKRVYWGVQRFIRWMESAEGARFAGDVQISGPFSHFDPKPPDVQVGDRGATRPRARNLGADSTGTGKEDYVIVCSFYIREQVQEVRTDVAEDLFREGKPGVRPMRERDYPWFQQR